MEYSLTWLTATDGIRNLRLNPYSNGILSDREDCASCRMEEKVLILILMEYSLTYNFKGLEVSDDGLNPYSNGILSDSF